MTLKFAKMCSVHAVKHVMFFSKGERDISVYLTVLADLLCILNISSCMLPVLCKMYYQYVYNVAYVLKT